MLSIRQRNGMRGVFLVAAELSRHGLNVELTPRKAAGTDPMPFSASTARARSIEVKTNARRANFWLVGERAREMSSDSHFYVFVNISNTKDGGELFEYFVVPSDVVAKKTIVQKHEKSTWYSFLLDHADPYRNKWLSLGKE